MAAVADRRSVAGAYWYRREMSPGSRFGSDVPDGMVVHRPAGAWRDSAIVVHRLGWQEADDSTQPGPLTRLVAALATRGWGVVSCEITDQADTDLETDPVIAAAVRWLDQRARTVRWLIGHGPGAAMALSAAPALADLRAVALICPEIAPSEGSAESGASFVEMFDAIEGPVLAVHGTVDDLTPIAEVEALFDRRRHGSIGTRSFVAIDRGDQHLTDPVAATCVAEIVGAWCASHIEPNLDDHQSGAAVEADRTVAGTDRVTVAESNLGQFHSQVVAGDHRFVADEPVTFGGFGAGPSPYDLLAAALGACTSMTLRMYADRKGIALERIEVGVSHDQVHANDAGVAGEIDNPGGPRGPRVDRFRRTIALEGELDPTMRTRLAEIANRCPVHRTLERSAIIETGLIEPEQMQSGGPS